MPAFNTPLDPFYDAYSIPATSFTLPDHFDIYEPTPENLVDFQCISVIAPSRARGAKAWTIAGRWITIGIYRDEGRPGTTSPTNFYEEHIVFRILPSFKLVKYSVIQELFELTKPVSRPSRRQLFNITLDKVVKVPNGKSVSTNYELAAASTEDRLNLPLRFDQVFDDDGNPLKLEYMPNGFPKAVNNVDSPTKNERLLFNTPVNSEIDGGDETRDFYPRVYDFYGIEVNDPNRLPFHAIDMITRDTTVVGDRNNFLRKKNGSGHVLFTGKLYDRFGNIALGIRENNTVLARSAILPLELDAFNVPTKAPSKG